MQTPADILDAITPGERHLPPSARTWARMIRTPYLLDVLEIRDPNDGADPDTSSKTRHQYVIARGALWGRVLPPAPLDRPDDETPWRDGPQASAWRLVPWSRHSLPWQWAAAQGIRPSDNATITGSTAAAPIAYVMPLTDPVDPWMDITSHPRDGHIVTCPVNGCGQHLVWHEAGYVPGYRACMAPMPRGTGYRASSIRHRFALGRRYGERQTLILDGAR